MVQNIAALEALSAAASENAPPTAAAATPSTPRRRDARKSPTKGERDSLATRLGHRHRFRISKRETASIAQLIAAQTRRANRPSDHVPRPTHREGLTLASVPDPDHCVAPTTDTDAAESAAQPTPDRKRPSHAARAGLPRPQTGATPPRHGVPSSASNHQNDTALLALARELGAFAVREAATPIEATPPRIKPLSTLHLSAPIQNEPKYRPKAVPLRYHERHDRRQGDGSASSAALQPKGEDETNQEPLAPDAEVEMAEPETGDTLSDDDAVYDLFVREPHNGSALAVNGAVYWPTDPKAPVEDSMGVLVLTEADEELWREDEEAEAETKSLSDYEDENGVPLCPPISPKETFFADARVAEDFYTNDYPEEEQDSAEESSDSTDFSRRGGSIRDSEDEEDDHWVLSGRRKAWQPKQRVLSNSEDEYVHSGDENGNGWAENEDAGEDE